MTMPGKLRFSSVLLLVLFLTGCGKLPSNTPFVTQTSSLQTTISQTPFQPLPNTPTPTPSPSPSPMPTSTPTPEPAVLIGAGDIAICGQKGDDQTAALLESISGTIFTAGDNSNEDGTQEQYQNCFGPSWGRFLDRIRPSPGNHDYNNGDGSAYFEYFGEAAGEPGKGYYSFDLGEWHIISLNSNCAYIGCSPDSAQAAWLQADLAQHPVPCTLAYWHHPRWSSGFAGNDGRIAPLWRMINQGGVDVVINGHEHHYERFAPMNEEGQVDEKNGTRQFVVGTGGVNLLGFGEVHPASEVRYAGSFGLLKLLLYSDHYRWEFIPTEGDFRDEGMGTCH